MKKITLLIIISLLINGMFGDEVLVMEGDSVTLHTNDADIQAADDVTVIWTYNKTRIARINRKANKAPIYDADVLDGRFKDRLKVNDQTGDLTITNIRTTDSGLYEAEITVGSKNIPKSYDVKGVSNPESDQLKSVSVKDADSVTLHTDVPDIKKYDEILWRFQGVPIAQFNKSVSKISEDERFRDKLQLDVQTGSLQIKNIRTDLSGLYEVEISSSGYTIHQTFTVTVSGEDKSVSVMKGDPVTIYTDIPDIKTYDQILLIFGCDDTIAEVNKQNKKFTFYGRIRDRLTLNDQTGDLTITDIRYEDGGLYELKMSSRRRSIQRRFSVNVSERGLSPAAIAGISLIFILLAAAAAAAAAGVIFYRRKIAKLFGETKTLEVDEGESADLKTEIKDIKTDDVIQWRFRETLIAEINPANNIFSTSNDDLFRDKLKLNHQTGDLNIKDIRQKQEGVYTLKIIRDGEISDKRLFVSVRGTKKELLVYDEEFVDLNTDLDDVKRVEKIEWRFKETLIAEINPANSIFRTYDGDYGLFKDKLNLNHQTGDLNINNFRREHSGVYTLKITRDGKTSYKRFTVIFKCERQMKVYEGESVNLKTEVKDIKRALIEWRFRETLIAEINPANNIFSTSDGDDDLFRGKLKLNHQTGDLNIKDLRLKHSGVYTLKITRDKKTSYKRFRVIVIYTAEELQVDEGESVNLKTEVKDIKRDDVIEWRFGDKETLIAKINPVNNILRKYDGDDDEFRGKLELKSQTGDLKISDIRWEHYGFYILKIIRDGEISERRFMLFVRRNKEELQVYEGKSVDLKTEVTDIQRDDLIEWRFGKKETVIAKINPVNNIFSTSNDDLFRDKLELNRKTGDLNINDIRQKHKGDYTLKIIKGGKTSYKRINVFVTGNVERLLVYEEESVDLKTEVTDIKRVEKIEWRFKETLIAEINPANNIFSTYDGDYDQFRGKVKLNHQTGDLNINDFREKHVGEYKLKIIRGGKTSDRRFMLFVRSKINTLEVNERESVDLKTEVTDIKTVEKIEWRFGDKQTVIAEINPANKIFSTYNGDDGLFRDKLKLNPQNGDLNINDIRQKQFGDYHLRIYRDKKSLLKRFKVIVKGEDSGRKRGGDSVETRREDSGDTEMQTLLPNSSDLPPV